LKLGFTSVLINGEIRPQLVHFLESLLTDLSKKLRRHLEKNM